MDNCLLSSGLSICITAQHQTMAGTTCKLPAPPPAPLAQEKLKQGRIGGEGYEVKWKSAPTAADIRASRLLCSWSPKEQPLALSTACITCRMLSLS